MRLQRRGKRMYLHVMWKHLEQQSFPLTEEEYDLQLQAGQCRQHRGITVVARRPSAATSSGAPVRRVQSLLPWGSRWVGRRVRGLEAALRVEVSGRGGLGPLLSVPLGQSCRLPSIEPATLCLWSCLLHLGV